MSTRGIFFVITVVALCALSCQALASAIASPTPPPSPTAVLTDTPVPSSTITSTPPPGQVISPDTVLKIPGMSSIVGTGTCEFTPGDEPDKCEVQIDGTIPVVDGKFCLCCVNLITIGADLKVPLDLFMPKKQQGVSAKMDMGLSWTNSEDLSEYLLSGPEGAKLEKVGDGFLLKEGAAYFVQSPKSPSTAMSEPTRTPSPKPTLASTSTFTPEPGRVYEAEGGFSYKPPEGWKVTQAPDFDFQVAYGAETGDFIPNLYFYDNNEHRGSLDEYVLISIEHNRTLLEGLKVISQEDFFTDEGKRGIKVVDESVQRNMRLRTTSYYFEAGGKKVGATYTRLADAGQSNDTLIDQSMKTFRPEAAPGPASQPSSVRMLEKTEAQKVLEEQDIESLASKAVERYSQEELDRVTVEGGTLTYNINLTQSEPIAWSMGWCTTTEAILAENFDHLRYTFTLNGQDIPVDQFVEYEYYSENVQGYCRVYRTVLTDWAPGEYTIQTVTTMDQPINDGWEDYVAGNRTYIYKVILK